MGACHRLAYAFLAFMSALILFQANAFAMAGQTICGVTFSDTVHSFKDASGAEILAIDSYGNVYIAAEKAATSAPVPNDATNGISMKSGVTAKWFFNSTNAYISGAIISIPQIPAAGANDVSLSNSTQTLAIFQGSSGNLIARGRIIYNSGQAGCASDGPMCKNGNVYARNNFCNFSKLPDGCDYTDALSTTCPDRCDDSDPTSSNTTKGVVNDSDACVSGTACPYVVTEDYCDASGLLHERNCTGNDAGPDIIVDCSHLNRCLGSVNQTFTCGNGICSATAKDCATDCSCSCGGYKTEESFSAGNCIDEIDNDCDGRTDEADLQKGCCSDECAAGESECVGYSNRTCGNYDDDACLEWSTPDDCSDCSCSCGVYIKIGDGTESGTAKCTDGIDNDCNNKADYDGEGSLPGDPGCPVSMVSASIEEHPTPPICPRAGSTPGYVTLKCRTDVDGVGCVKATLGGAECAFTGWESGEARFNCVLGSGTAQSCPDTDRAKSAVCSIDMQQCISTDPSRSLSVSVLPSGCGGYDTSTACATDAACEWCFNCLGTSDKRYSPSVGCVPRGTCARSCVQYQCGAGCTNDDNCPATCDGQTAVTKVCSEQSCSCIESGRVNCDSKETGAECWNICYPVDASGGDGNIHQQCNDWLCDSGSCANSVNDIFKAVTETCTDTCTDSDSGKMKNMAGQVTDTNKCSGTQTACQQATVIKKDICDVSNADNVIEWYCSGLASYSETMACGQGMGCRDDGNGGYCFDCDDDNDGYCEAPYDSPADCNDNGHPEIHPGATEACDTIDQDCDGAPNTQNYVALTTQSGCNTLGSCAASKKTCLSNGAWSATCDILPSSAWLSSPRYGSWDGDCSGYVTKIENSIGSCKNAPLQSDPACSRDSDCIESEGWENGIPDCGQTGDIVSGRCWPYSYGKRCRTFACTDSQTQQCK